MVDGIEGVGDAVTGGMAARAVEPRAGEAAGHAGACLNCGTGRVGDYCHRCGQSGHIHRTLQAFWHDIAHSVLHFDGKVWRTLPLLAWRPGELTRRYIAGERARFVSPMALFLFSVFLMFAVFSLIGGPLELKSHTPGQDRAEARRDFSEQRAESAAELRRLEAALAQARARRGNTASIEGDIRAARFELAVQERAYKFALRLANEEEQREARQAEGKPEGAPDAQDLDIRLKTGWQPFDAAIEKAENNPSLLFYKVQNNAYKFSWALIPLSLPFVWLMFFWKRRYKLYDHTVFVTYSIAFMSLAAVTLALLRPLGIGETPLGLAVAFVPPIHMYRQLRAAYQLSRLGAAVRAFLLLNFSFVAAGLFFSLLLALGVLG